VLSFSDAGPTKVSPQARGPASEKLQRTKPRWGAPTWPTITNGIARPQEINRRLIFGPIAPESRCNLDVLGRILRLMGISRFVLSMISNVRRGKKATEDNFCANWLRMRFQPHLIDEFFEESKRPSVIQRNGFSSRSSRLSRISAIPDRLHSLFGIIG
jgi:hypothetical protein